MQDAKKALDRGWYVSFSGIVTFKKSEGLRDIVKTVPLDRLLIETDCPFLAPIPYRSRRNEPAFIVETAKVVASLKEISLHALAEVTSKNAKAFFCLG
jgi:TatD DNase family protein